MATPLFESDAYMTFAGVASVATAVAMGAGISLRFFFPFLSFMECLAAAAPLGLTLSAWVVSAEAVGGCSPKTQSAPPLPLCGGLHDPRSLPLPHAHELNGGFIALWFCIGRDGVGCSRKGERVAMAAAPPHTYLTAVFFFGRVLCGLRTPHAWALRLMTPRAAPLP
jgi:hypothetical protein